MVAIRPRMHVTLGWVLHTDIRHLINILLASMKLTLLRARGVVQWYKAYLVWLGLGAMIY